MLQPGNKKLGPSIHSFSLPRIVTCPGATDVCKQVCYAGRGHFRHAGVKDSYEENLRCVRRTSCVTDLVAEIRKKHVKCLRIHTSGDFMNTKYVNRWLEVVRRCRQTTFFAYTRSWRKPRMCHALEQLAAEPNVHLWWSTDQETHAKQGRPALAGGKIAYMATSADDTVPAYADIVFRTYTTPVEKFKDGVFVCAAEQGVKPNRGAKITCSRCRVCFRGQCAPRTADVAEVSARCNAGRSRANRCCRSALPV